MIITKTSQQVLDIDWFFLDKEYIVFVASGGGQLPNSISKSFEDNKLLASYFRSLAPTSEVIINSDLGRILAESINEEYLADFIEMGKKGLFTFDKTILNDFSNTQYHLVTKPVNPLGVDRLPHEVKRILSKFRYDGNVGLTIDINLIP